MTPNQILAYIEEQLKKAHKAYMLSDSARERHFYYVQEIVLKDLIVKLKGKQNESDKAKF